MDIVAAWMEEKKGEGRIKQGQGSMKFNFLQQSMLRCQHKLLLGVCRVVGRQVEGGHNVKLHLVLLTIYYYRFARHPSRIWPLKPNSAQQRIRLIQLILDSRHQNRMREAAKGLLHRNVSGHKGTGVKLFVFHFYKWTIGISHHCQVLLQPTTDIAKVPTQEQYQVSQNTVPQPKHSQKPYYFPHTSIMTTMMSSYQGCKTLHCPTKDPQAFYTTGAIPSCFLGLDQFPQLATKLYKNKYNDDAGDNGRTMRSKSSRAP